MSESRSVIVTGAASGIGRALADALVARGDRVIAADLDVASLRAHAKAEGWPAERALARKLDVRDRAAWKRLVSLAVQRFGRLDALLNVAGYLKPGYLHETEPDEIDRHLDVNTKGVMLGTRAAAIAMIEQGDGHIVNVASLAALAPVPGLNLYSASKFAVRGFSLAVAQELRDHGVAVTTVCPDAVQTPMLDLQVDYPEASLTFSGDEVLTAEGVAEAILEALETRPLEVELPPSRAKLAKLASFFPDLAFFIGPLLARKGRARQRQRR